MYDVALSCMVKRFEGIVFGTVAIPSIDIFYVTTRLYTSHYFKTCVFSSELIARCARRCARTWLFFSGTHFFVNVSWLGACYFVGSRSRKVRGRVLRRQ